MGVSMTNSMKDQIEILIKLQTLDNEKHSLQLALDQVNSQIESLERPLENHEQALQKKKEKLENFRKVYRDLDRKVQSRRSQIEKSREKVRSVKTNKEYQSILKEIDDLKASVSDIEDEILENLERIENIEIEVNSDQKTLQELRRDIKRKKKAIEDEAEKKRNNLDILIKSRESVENNLAREIVVRYDKVKAKVGLIAVAEAKEAVCQGCHVNIPPQLYNELQRYERLVQCPNCQRIIYFNTK
jgi:predicted  nucleic acid-binding Zn-ribbon protein